MKNEVCWGHKILRKMQMNKRVLITAGGTGGHIYPAISLAEQLMQTTPGIELFFAGGKLADNRFFARQTYPFQSIDCGKFTGKNPLSLGMNLINIGRGFCQSRNIIKKFSPDLVVGFGSYHTFPLLLAACLSSIPFILHEANSVAGRVNRFLSKYAKATGIYLPQSAGQLQGRVLPVKIPLRKDFHYGCCTMEEARKELGLDLSLPTLLIFGGSQGARTLNERCAQACAQISSNSWQILHLTGYSEEGKSIRQTYEKAGIPHCVKPFEQRMNLAWKAADMAIARAGAGTIAEAIEFEVPALLIPYPHATDNHQDKNADFLIQTVKGGMKLSESEASAAYIASILERWFNGSELARMRQAIRAHKNESQWKELADLVLEELER